jgi:cyclophilin family peptidyl-prolyl cis-trans isomerase
LDGRTGRGARRRGDRGPVAERRYPADLVGTAKRERQKANRQARLEQLAKEARQQKTRKRGLTIAVVVIGGVLLLFGLAWLLGDDEDDTAAVATTVATVPATTVAPVDTSDIPATTEVPATTAAPTTTEAPEFVYGDQPCAEENSVPEGFLYEGAPQLCIDPAKAYTAEVTTNFGAFTIELNTEGAPGNVNNFVNLARSGYYDGSGCHRIIADFVVQCGRPGELEEAPGYNVADELPTEPYEIGMVAMANTGAPNTGGGQWFVITGENGASLPQQYTVLGTVTDGLDSSVRALANLADPTANNGVPPLSEVVIESVTITES